jgi:hypothetical protein
MRRLESRTEATERESAIAALILRMAALFRRLPMLSGFSVQDADTLAEDRDLVPLDEDLCIADVSVHAWPGLEATQAMCEEIAQSILELLEEHPDARELLRGYTFARAFH